MKQFLSKKAASLLLKVAVTATVFGFASIVATPSYAVPVTGHVKDKGDACDKDCHPVFFGDDEFGDHAKEIPLTNIYIYGCGGNETDTKCCFKKIYCCNIRLYTSKFNCDNNISPTPAFSEPRNSAVDTVGINARCPTGTRG